MLVLFLKASAIQILIFLTNKSIFGVIRKFENAPIVTISILEGE